MEPKITECSTHKFTFNNSVKDNVYIFSQCEFFGHDVNQVDIASALATEMSKISHWSRNTRQTQDNFLF